MSGEYDIYLLFAAVFVTVVAACDGLYAYWKGMNVPGRARVNQRLHELYAGGVGREEALSLLRKQQISDNELLDSIYTSIPRVVVLHRFIEQSGLHLSVSGFLFMQLFLAVITFIGISLFSIFPVSLSLIISIAFGFFVPYLYVKSRTTHRKNMFRLQLPEALDFIARSLRAGNPLSAAIKQVSVEMPDPISTEFGITFDELNFGLELDFSLHGLYERTQSEEVRYFVTAVILQKETGGNLAEVLNRIAVIIRSRSSTKKEIGILSAEMKLSANVLLFLPFLVAGAVSIMSPGYLSPLLETREGLFVVAGQVFLMAMGYFILKRMVNFHV